MNTDLFFKSLDDLEWMGLGFSLWGPGHLIWLGCIFLAVWLISSAYRKAGYKRRRLIAGIFAFFLPVSEIIKDCYTAAIGQFNIEYFPFHLCGISIFIILIDYLRPNRFTSQLVMYACMPGALAALLCCNWTAVPFFNFFCIHSFVFHAVIVIYAICRYRGREIRPEYSGIWKSVAVVYGWAIPMIAVNGKFDTNFLFLNKASEGSPLTVLVDLFGEDMYYVSFALFVLIVWHIMYGVYSLINRAVFRGGAFEMGV